MAPKKHSPLAGPMAALIYACISIAIMLFNKGLLGSYKFRFAKVLTAWQSTTTLVVMTLAARTGLIKLRPLELDVARQVAPMSFLFLGYVIISLSALGTVNMPMFTALRRTSVMFVMAGEWALLRRWPSKRVRWATLVIVTGAVIAASRDMTFDPMSYLVLLGTNSFGALYSVFIARVKKSTQLDPLSLLYYNTVITVPFLLIYCYASGEFAQALAFKHFGDRYFQGMLLASCFLAFLLNWTTVRNTTINSPMTHTVTGQVKNFIAFLLSLYLFSDYVYDPANFMGLLVGFSGGVLYAAGKLMDKRDAAAAAAADSAVKSPDV